MGQPTLRHAALLLTVACLTAILLQEGHAQSADHAVAVEVSKIDELSVGGDFATNVSGNSVGGSWVNGKNVDGSLTTELAITTDAQGSQKVTGSASKISGEDLRNLGLRVYPNFLPGGSKKPFGGKLVLTSLGNEMRKTRDLIRDTSGVDTSRPYVKYPAQANVDYDAGVETKVRVTHTSVAQNS